MKLPTTDILIALLASIVAVSALHRVRGALAVPQDELANRVVGRVSSASRAPVSTVTADSIDYARFVIENDLFRLANAPADVRYTLATEGMPGVQQPSGVRPQLVVKAVIGGPPWQAMLEGVPGSGPVVVRTGQVLGALTVRSVGRDTVVVQGPDTTWKLTLHGGRP